jgi:hypothetical protein
VNVKVLIDAIVRQNMVLVAQLSTTAGLRAPLAHVANDVFLDLVGELESQGVRQRVIADMFGLALRSYQRKVQRLAESRTEHGRSLWEAVLSYVQEQEVVPRAEVLRRFRFDDESSVRGVLDDLVGTGLLYKRGRRDTTEYRASQDDDRETTGDTATALVWVCVYREGPLNRDDLNKQIRLDSLEIDTALEVLVADGRVRKLSDGANANYECNAFFTAYDEPNGWEAALFDHYQAVVRAIVTKLQAGSTTARRADETGGSTYSFDVWPGHPYEERARSLLRTHREQADELLEDVHRFNESHQRPEEFTRVSFYFGQSTDDEMTDE